MEWPRAIAKGAFTGTAVGVLLLVALAVGAPNFDELLVVLPIMATELVVLYAATLTLAISRSSRACARQASRER